MASSFNVALSEIEIVTAAVPSRFLEPELPDPTLATEAESRFEKKDAIAKRSGYWTICDELPGLDFLSIRVSECNIYGKIYPVGQVIKELSDSCKPCTCTSQGVECESKC